MVAIKASSSCCWVHGENRFCDIGIPVSLRFVDAGPKPRRTVFLASRRNTYLQTYQGEPGVAPENRTFRQSHEPFSLLWGNPMEGSIAVASVINKPIIEPGIHEQCFKTESWHAYVSGQADAQMINFNQRLLGQEPPTMYLLTAECHHGFKSQLYA